MEPKPNCFPKCSIHTLRYSRWQYAALKLWSANRVPQECDRKLEIKQILTEPHRTAPFSLASNFPTGHSQYWTDKPPCGQKSIFLIKHHHRKDVFQTVDRTP